MSDKMNSDEQIQQLYNRTKTLKSPADLDSLILGKIRSLEDQPVPPQQEKSWIYLPIAASILLAVFLHFKDADTPEQQFSKKSAEIARLPIENRSAPKQKNADKNQLPEMFFVPHEDINSKIVPACNGELIEPEGILDKMTESNKAKGKPSNLPIKPIYPNNASKKKPACDSVSGTVFKK